jgi:hypothetical protein
MTQRARSSLIAAKAPMPVEEWKIDDGNRLTPKG